MRNVSNITRYFLGLIFTVFGLNGFLNFIPASPMPPLAGQFVGALVQSHFMVVVFALELGCGLLLLANRYVPLALTTLAPVIFNIVLFHIFLAPAGLPLAALVVVLWFVLAYRIRYVFFGILQHSIEVTEHKRANPATAVLTT